MCHDKLLTADTDNITYNNLLFYAHAKAIKCIYVCSIKYNNCGISQHSTRIKNLGITRKCWIQVSIEGKKKPHPSHKQASNSKETTIEHFVMHLSIFAIIISNIFSRIQIASGVHHCLSSSMTNNQQSITTAVESSLALDKGCWRGKKTLVSGCFWTP